jgi:3-deoxy-D-manno-octulosonate 8-phosphate phosphatase KdsC-like HAD superfamily phosphatase
MYYAESGDEWKKFNTHDGMGIKLLQRAGSSPLGDAGADSPVARRAEATIPELHQGV